MKAAPFGGESVAFTWLNLRSKRAMASFLRGAELPAAAAARATEALQRAAIALSSADPNVKQKDEGQGPGGWGRREREGSWKRVK